MVTGDTGGTNGKITVVVNADDTVNMTSGGFKDESA